MIHKSSPILPAYKQLISANNLTCIREERILFEQLNLQVTAGDIVQIEGANGTGKTSLLLSFIDGEYRQHPNCTIGVDFKLKLMKVDKVPIKL